MNNENLPIIGISCGDLNGIGLEVVMKTFSDNQMLELCTPVIFANSKVISYHRKALQLNDFNFQVLQSLDQIKPKKIWIHNAWKEQVNLNFGELNNEVGSFALKSIDAGLDAYQDKIIDALVTAPINKQNIAVEGKKFTGHTGYIGDAVEGEPLMILTHGGLRVALVTGHIPLAEVAQKLSTEIIEEKIAQFNHSLRQDFGIRKPKIAILGLNPHAGDDGLLGKEEIEIIKPAIENAEKKNIIAIGPYAADGFFGAEIFKQFDGVLAMYHDQGLVPFKTLAFNNGVNFTAGLPIVRTSPDHGTGMSIAGQGKAIETSFREAVYAAIDVVRLRKEFSEINANPLKSQKLDRKRDR